MRQRVPKFAPSDDPSRPEYEPIGEYSYKEAANVSIATGQVGNRGSD